jgi:hypothetical protein
MKSVTVNDFNVEVAEAGSKVAVGHVVSRVRIRAKTVDVQLLDQFPVQHDSRST